MWGLQKDRVTCLYSSSEMLPDSCPMLVCILLAQLTQPVPSPGVHPSTKNPTEIASINTSHPPLRTCSLKGYFFPETPGCPLSEGQLRRITPPHPPPPQCIAPESGSSARAEAPTVSTDAYLLNMWVCSALYEAPFIHEVGECYTHFTDGKTEAP